MTKHAAGSNSTQEVPGCRLIKAGGTAGVTSLGLMGVGHHSACSERSGCHLGRAEEEGGKGGGR